MSQIALVGDPHCRREAVRSRETFGWWIFSTLQAWLNCVSAATPWAASQHLRSRCQERSFDFILDRGDRFKVVRDRQSILTTHLTIAVGGALYRIVHESAHVIQVGLRTGNYQIGDFFALPGADPGLLIGSDVRDALAKGTDVLACSCHIHRPVGNTDGTSRRMTIAADRD